jgi:hypothetical protein
MANSGMLQKVELIIVALLSIIFLVWAASKCNSSGKEELPLTSAQEVVADTSQTETTVAGPAEEDVKADKSQPSLIREKYTPLYVTIDGLKLRAEPDLNSEVITLLGLFEEVEFMNEVTDSTLQISLGYEMADEPWVKVKHRKGQVGWVYGAGVSYYKKKREGVLE